MRSDLKYLYSNLESIFQIRKPFFLSEGLTPVILIVAEPTGHASALAPSKIQSMLFLSLKECGRKQNTASRKTP